MSANTRLSEQDRQILQLSKLSHEAHELIVKEARSSYSISLLMMALQLFKENKLCSTSLMATNDNRSPEQRRADFRTDLKKLGELECFENFWLKLSPRTRNRIHYLTKVDNPMKSFLRRSERDLRCFRGIGNMAILDINAVLYSYGLTMGMSEDEIYELFH